MLHLPLTAEIQLALKDMDYPASKQESVQKAKDNSSIQDFIQVIENLTDKNLNSPRDVQKTCEKKDN